MLEYQTVPGIGVLPISDTFVSGLGQNKAWFLQQRKTYVLLQVNKPTTLGPLYPPLSWELRTWAKDMERRTGMGKSSAVLSENLNRNRDVMILGAKVCREILP